MARRAGWQLFIQLSRPKSAKSCCWLSPPLQECSRKSAAASSSSSASEAVSAPGSSASCTKPRSRPHFAEVERTGLGWGEGSGRSANVVAAARAGSRPRTRAKIAGKDGAAPADQRTARARPRHWPAVVSRSREGCVRVSASAAAVCSSSSAARQAAESAAARAERFCFSSTARLRRSSEPRPRVWMFSAASSGCSPAIWRRTTRSAATWKRTIGSRCSWPLGPSSGSQLKSRCRTIRALRKRLLCCRLFSSASCWSRGMILGHSSLLTEAMISAMGCSSLNSCMAEDIHSRVVWKGKYAGCRNKTRRLRRRTCFSSAGREVSTRSARSFFFCACKILICAEELVSVDIWSRVSRQSAGVRGSLASNSERSRETGASDLSCRETNCFLRLTFPTIREGGGAGEGMKREEVAAGRWTSDLSPYNRLSRQESLDRGGAAAARSIVVASPRCSPLLLLPGRASAASPVLSSGASSSLLVLHLDKSTRIDLFLFVQWLVLEAICSSDREESHLMEIGVLQRRSLTRLVYPLIRVMPCP